MKVGIIGTGAIGLGSVALLLSLNHKPIIWSPSGKGIHAFKKNKKLIARGKVEGEFSPSVVKSAKELALKSDIIKLAVPAYAHKLLLRPFPLLLSQDTSLRFLRMLLLVHYICQKNLLNARLIHWLLPGVLQFYQGKKQGTQV